MNQAPGTQSMQVNIDLPNDLDATYANFALITHSPSEVIVDFARVLPGSPRARVQARIVMTPMNAKSLLKALGENLDNFEKQFGAIKMPEGGFSADKPMGFVK